jgi:hypothetical protein
MSYFPNVPVPAVNSADNVYQSDVVGNKGDDEDGSSLYAQNYKANRHVHSIARVYPTLAASIDVTKDVAPWTLGAFAVLVPAGTITSPFDIHGLNFGEVPNAGEYEIVIYAGADGAEVEVGRTRFARQGGNTVQLESPFQTPIIAANTQIKAKLAGSNGSATAVPTSIRYHTY